MLADISVVDRIYIITGRTDMRKSIDGLCAIIKDLMDEDQPDGRSLYLFCGRRCDRIKAIDKLQELLGSSGGQGNGAGLLDAILSSAEALGSRSGSENDDL